MDILGVGFTELMVILIIAMIVFGPRRLPEIAVKAGKIVRDLRSMSQGLMLEWQREITVASRLDDLEETRQELARLKKELGQTQREIGHQARKGVEQVQKQIAAEASKTEEILKLETEPPSSKALPTDSKTDSAPEPSGEDLAPEITSEERGPQTVNSVPESAPQQKPQAETGPVDAGPDLAASPQIEAVPGPAESKGIKPNGRSSTPDDVSDSVPTSSTMTSSEQPSKPKEALNE